MKRINTAEVTLKKNAENNLDGICEKVQRQIETKRRFVLRFRKLKFMEQERRHGELETQDILKVR